MSRGREQHLFTSLCFCTPCPLFFTRHSTLSSLNPRLLRKKQLDLEAQLPFGTKLRTMHVAKRLELRVDR